MINELDAYKKCRLYKLYDIQSLPLLFMFLFQKANLIYYNSSFINILRIYDSITDRLKGMFTLDFGLG